MEKRHRIFIAINLPNEVKKQLNRYSEKWPDLPCRWTKKDNLHVTLVFLGELTDVELADVCVAVKDVSVRHQAFDILLNKVSFGPENKFKYIWVSGEKSKELQNLKNELEGQILEKVRFKPEGRGFAPHITLARVSEWEIKQRDPEEIPDISENLDLFFTVESIEVMESELKKGGPVYTVLESHTLGKNED